MNKAQLLELLNNAIPDKALFIEINVEMYAEHEDRETTLKYLAEVGPHEMLTNGKIETTVEPGEARLGFRIARA